MSKINSKYVGIPLAVSADKAEAMFFMLDMPSFEPVTYELEGSTAVIPFMGPIYDVPRYWSLGTAIKAANADDKVENIRLDIDSPGGLVSGLFDVVRTIEGSAKPTKARVIGEACSAAYLIAAATGEIESYSTGVVGSIGCVITTYPSFDEEFGVIKFLASVSPNKQAGPDTPEGASQYQDLVNDSGDSFVSELSRIRGISAEDVINNYGGGLVMSATRAIDKGMIDTLLDQEAIDMDEDKLETPEEELETLETPEEEAETPEEEVAEEEAEEAKAEEEEAEMSPEDKIKDLETKLGEKDDLVKDLEERLRKLENPEEEAEEAEEAKAEASAETLALQAQLEQANAMAYDATRAVVISEMKAKGIIKPADEALAINAYDGEQRGEHTLFTQYYVSRKPVIDLGTRTSHNASTKAAATGDVKDTLSDRINAYCITNSLDPKNPSHFKSAFDKLVSIS